MASPRHVRRLAAISVALTISACSESTGASLETTLVVDPDGGVEPSPEVSMGAVEFEVNEYGGVDAWVEITNPSTEEIEELHVGIVCMDGLGDVIGGGDDYRNIRPQDTTRVHLRNMLTSGLPDQCEAYAGPPFDAVPDPPA